jgi:hypothetical protein
MDCEVRTRLVSECEGATTVLTQLLLQIGTSSKSEYERRVEEARAKAEEARTALQRHVAVHQC